jgi:hypothetical protein
MHTAMIFKGQANVKEPGLSLAQPHYSIQHIEGYDLLCYKEKIYIPQSLRQRLLSYTMNIYFIRDRLELKREDYQEYHDMPWSYTRC